MILGSNILSEKEIYSKFSRFKKYKLGLLFHIFHTDVAILASCAWRCLMVLDVQEA